MKGQMVRSFEVSGYSLSKDWLIINSLMRERRKNSKDEFFHDACQNWSQQHKQITTVEILTVGSNNHCDKEIQMFKKVIPLYSPSKKVYRQGTQ